jgi:hypothetical protein
LERQVKQSLEHTWVSLKDSDRFRRFARSRVGSRVFRGRAFKQALETKSFLTSLYHTRTKPEIFSGVSTFCLFVGHTKSGGTMIGSLLDAHRNVILADEIDVLGLIAEGYSKEQIYYLLVRGSRREAIKGRVTARRLQPYSFMVPGQWQGRYKRLQLIGVSSAGPTTRRYGSEPKLLGRMCQVMNGVEVKLVQVIRNPFDPISVTIVRGSRTFENAVEHYFDFCDTLVAMRERHDNLALMPVRYESFVRSPESMLSQICRFLDIEAGAEYMSTATAIVHDAPDRSRQMVDWEPNWIRVVEERLARYDFLKGYSFDN